MPEKILQKDHEKGILPDSFNDPSQAYDGDLKLYQDQKQKQHEQRQQARFFITPSPWAILAGPFRPPIAVPLFEYMNLPAYFDFSNPDSAPIASG